MNLVATVYVLVGAGILAAVIAVRLYRYRRALLYIDKQLAAIQETNAEAKPGDPHYQLVCEIAYTGFDDALAYLRETAQKALL